MRIPKGAKRLGTLHVANMATPIIRATAKQWPGLVDGDATLLGCADDEANVIVVRDGQDPSQERDSVNHECVHRFLAASGLRNVIRDEVLSRRRPGESVEDAEAAYEAFEERIVRVATPLIPTTRLVLK